VDVHAGWGWGVSTVQQWGKDWALHKALKAGTSWFRGGQDTIGGWAPLHVARRGGGGQGRRGLVLHRALVSWCRRAEHTTGAGWSFHAYRGSDLGGGARGCEDRIQQYF
jgi:hypothetical protein